MTHNPCDMYGSMPAGIISTLFSTYALLYKKRKVVIGQSPQSGQRGFFIPSSMQKEGEPVIKIAWTRF